MENHIFKPDRQTVDTITEEEFIAYRAVREEREVPMYKISEVSTLTNLTSCIIFIIGDNYDYLSNKFGRK